MQSGIVMLHIMTNNSISTGLILLAPTVYEVLGGNVVERASNYKLLGVQLSDDLKWNNHVDYIYKKACKKLYSLCVLRRAGVEQRSILKFI